MKSNELYQQMIDKYNSLENHFNFLEKEYLYESDRSINKPKQHS